MPVLRFFAVPKANLLEMIGASVAVRAITFGDYLTAVIVFVIACAVSGFARFVVEDLEAQENDR